MEIISNTILIIYIDMFTLWLRIQQFRIPQIPINILTKIDKMVLQKLTQYFFIFPNKIKSFILFIYSIYLQFNLVKFHFYNVSKTRSTKMTYILLFLFFIFALTVYRKHKAHVHS